MMRYRVTYMFGVLIVGVGCQRALSAYFVNQKVIPMRIIFILCNNFIRPRETNYYL